jgi:hypothetical protein
LRVFGGAMLGTRHETDPPHLDFGTLIPRGPANAMNNSGTITQDGGSGPNFEAFPGPTGINCRDWRISRCRRTLASRK